jgi:hypothetical protein
MADWKSVRAFFRSLRATARLRPKAMPRGRRVKIPAGRSMALDVCWTLRTQRRLLIGRRFFGAVVRRRFMSRLLT